MPQYLSYQDLSELLGIPVGTLQNWVARRSLPFHRLAGRTVRFSREAIDAWMAANEVKPKARTIEDKTKAWKESLK